MWAVILFTEENEVEAVPSAWLTPSKKKAHWPPYRSSKRLNRVIREGALAEDDWDLYDVRVLGCYGTYEAARDKSKLAEDTSDIGYLSEGHPTGRGARNHKRKVPFTPDGCESDDEEELLPPLAVDKRKKASKFPDAPLPPPLPASMNISSGAALSRTGSSPCSSVACTYDGALDSRSPPRSASSRTGTSEPHSDVSNSSILKILLQVKQINVELLLLGKKHAEEHHDIITRLKQLEQPSRRRQGSPGPSPSQPPPLADMESFKINEIRLQDDPGFRRCQEEQLSTLGGSSIKLAVKNVVNACMVHSLQCQFNWLGKLGWKKIGAECRQGFKDTHLLSVITATTTAGRRLLRVQQILHRHCMRQTSSDPLHTDVIQVTPKCSRFDQKVAIKLQGLPSQAKVTLHALTSHEWRREPARFVSCAHYVANPSGEVDLQKDASFGGTYTGVEPMGPFWSMQPCPLGPKHMRMVVKHVDRPVHYTLSLFSGHVSLNDLQSDGAHERPPLATTELERVVMPGGVRRIPVTAENGVRGMLFLPPGEGPFPGVIDMFGLAGGLMEIRASMLAANGFAALALPFFRYADLPENLLDQTFDYFENAAKWMGSHPSVCPGGIGLVGISGGAALSLVMAWKCPEVKAFVRINGPGFMGLMDFYQKGELIRKGVQLDLDRCPVTEEGRHIGEGWMYTEEDFIPLWERSDVHMLCLACDDDTQMPPKTADIHYRLYPEDKRHLVEVVHYPGAGHLLEPPYTPLCRTCYNPYFNGVLRWGGYVKEHAIAQEDSWQRILTFLRKHLPSAPHSQL